MSGRDYREELTARIIEMLEQGTAPWVKPWDASIGNRNMPFNPTTGKPYRGANSLGLSAQGLFMQYEDPRWCTFNQAKEQGWKIRKGEKGTWIEYWKFTADRAKADAAGNPVFDAKGKREMETFRLERPQSFHAVVFNVRQMDGVPELTPAEYDWNPDEKAERILKSSGAQFFYDQADKAFYRSSTDSIHSPAREQFKTAAAFYGTQVHELGHWTGHPDRLARDMSGSFGSQSYAREELRAELFSYFISGRLGIPHDPEQHASYVGIWIAVLKEDKNEIFRASRDAEAIVDLVMSYDREQVKTAAAEKEASALASHIEPAGIKMFSDAVAAIKTARTEQHFQDVQYALEVALVRKNEPIVMLDENWIEYSGAIRQRREVLKNAGEKKVAVEEVSFRELAGKEAERLFSGDPDRQAQFVSMAERRHRENEKDAQPVMRSDFKEGDRVNWLCRPRGGYGFTQNVAGIVVGVKGDRAEIEVRHKVGNEWVPENKLVSKTSLRPRDSLSEAFGERTQQQSEKKAARNANRRQAARKSDDLER